MRDDGENMPDDNDWNPTVRSPLADAPFLQVDYPRMRNYEYVMCGKVYRIEGDTDHATGEAGRL